MKPPDTGKYRMTVAGYFDQKGSDHILNAIITESRYSSRVIQYFMRLIETSFLALMYLVIAFYLSPTLTIFTLVVLGLVTYLFRGGARAGLFRRRSRGDCERAGT